MTCPYTKGKLYKETMDGTLVELNPEKDDNIYEISESLAYKIEYHNRKTHVKKPLKGIRVTTGIPNKPKSATILETDSKGMVYFKPEKEGSFYLTYYDPYEKQSPLISFQVVKPKEKTTPKPKPKPKPEPCDTSRWDKMITHLERILQFLKLRREESCKPKPKKN